MEDRYLGDGVYASFDGFMIWLDLRGQDSTTKIALEPGVFNGLIKYNQDVAEHCQQFLPIPLKTEDVG